MTSISDETPAVLERVVARSPFERLSERLASRRARIGVIGLGYVGLPLGLACADAGFGVLGFDINEERVDAVNEARNVISYIATERMLDAVNSGRLEATADFSRLSEADVIIICVPTPISRNREPDLSYVTATVDAVRHRLQPGQLVILESTTWPGTTREVVTPALAASGLLVGEDFFVAFSPEREDPGNLQFTTTNIPKIVGADDQRSQTLAVAFYEAVVAEVVQVPNTLTAEATKLTENIFRSVNIALVNELKIVYREMGVDIWDVIEAASTKPFGFLPFYPGPGLGGHCIPIDPFYLTWKAREFGMETRFIELAGQVNLAMPKYVVERLSEGLDRVAGRGLMGARILIIGVAYKRNVDDLRESPALVIMEQIEARGGHCDYHDPHIPAIPATRQHACLSGRRSQPLTAEALRSYDAVVIATDHDDVDYSLIVASAKLAVDTRNVFHRRGLCSSRIVKA